MDINKLKKEMMKLWKKEFHDSDEYIKLIFDNYFQPSYICYREKEGRLIASMLAVPYQFGIVHKCADMKMKNQTLYDIDTIISNDVIKNDCSKNNQHEINEKVNLDKDNINNGESEMLRGLYLCGLVTENDYRGIGIMSEMIEEMNRRAVDMNFDFTFLIPANEGLKKYYYDRGYVETFYQNKYKYICGHDFRNDFIKVNDDAEALRRFDNIKVISFDITACDSDDKCCESEGRNVESSQREACETEEINPDVNNEKITENELVDFLMRNEAISGNISLKHSRKDWQAVIADNQQSCGLIAVALDRDNSCVDDFDDKRMGKNICAVAFVTFSDSGDASVKALYCDDMCAEYALLDSLTQLIIKSRGKEKSTSVRHNNIRTPRAVSEIRSEVIAENDENGAVETMEVISTGTPDDINGSANKKEIETDDLFNIEITVSSVCYYPKSNCEKGIINRCELSHNLKCKDDQPQRSEIDDNGSNQHNGERIVSQTISQSYRGRDYSIKDDCRRKNEKNRVVVDDENKSEKGSGNRTGAIENVETEVGMMGDILERFAREGSGFDFQPGHGVSHSASRSLDRDEEGWADGPTGSANQLWSPVYGASLPEASDVGAFAERLAPYSPGAYAPSYGMLRLLNVQNILKFIATDPRSEKYSILVTVIPNHKSVNLHTNNGDYIVNCDKCCNDSRNLPKEITDSKVIISSKELAEILFRRPGSAKIVEEAFGIPSIPISMALMLD